MKIGIALGSGAAKGWAHIGIIQALEEAGINIDVVAGCSIGAYVGVAYASGKLDELATWVKSLSEWQVVNLMGVGFRRGGIVSGQKVFDTLQEQFCAASFDQLNKPFACVATDLYSGKEINFYDGDIIDAVRASCAIPGVFRPTRHKQSWLVDGAVVNPVPVNLCRQLGADLVIAVNLCADFRPDSLENSDKIHEQNQQKISRLLSKGQAHIQQFFKGGNQSPPSEKTQNTQAKPAFPSMIGVMSGALDIMQGRITRSRLAGDPPEVLIEPQLADFGIMEFYRAAELIEQGYQSAQRLTEQIKYQMGLA